MKEKFKSFLENDQYFYGLLVILVGLISFILGQKSVSSVEERPKESLVSIESAELRIDNHTEEVKIPDFQQEIVASKKGSKYHLVSCPGASSIKVENRLVFTSIAAAKAAGYTPATNCKGLE